MVLKEQTICSQHNTNSIRFRKLLLNIKIKILHRRTFICPLLSLNVALWDDIEIGVEVWIVEDSSWFAGNYIEYGGSKHLLWSKIYISWIPVSLFFFYFYQMSQQTEMSPMLLCMQSSTKQNGSTQNSYQRMSLCPRKVKFFVYNFIALTAK